jgi:hypothetical protein
MAGTGGLIPEYMFDDLSKIANLTGSVPRADR